MFPCGGYHIYGHNDSWRVLPTWRQALDAPGAVQMGHLKRAFERRAEWWYLVPVAAIFAEGSNTAGAVCRHSRRPRDGRTHF